MKIKKSELQKIIKEELERAIAEAMPAPQMSPESPESGQEADKVSLAKKIKAAAMELGQLLGNFGMDMVEIINPSIAREFDDLSSGDPNKVAAATAAISDRFSGLPEEQEEYEEAQPTKPQSPKGGHRDVQEDEE